MPHIVIYGIPRIINRHQHELEQLIMKIKGAVANIPELELTREHVTVSMPSDRYLIGHGEELIVHVVGLFDRETRDMFVITNMNAAILACCMRFAKERLPMCWQIEVFLPDRPLIGFAKGNPQK